MISLYQNANDAWSDYFNNGFKYYSSGNFFGDFINFFKNNYTSEYLEYMLEFYRENYPSVDIINVPLHIRSIPKNLQIEFFDCCPTKIQKNYIDFCYKSIEQVYFQDQQEEIFYEVEGNVTQNQEVIDLTADTEDEETDTDMPELLDEDNIPELEDDVELVSAVQSHFNNFINNFIPIAPTVELENTEVVHPDQDDSCLYDDLFGSSDDEDDEEVEHPQQ